MAILDRLTRAAAVAALALVSAACALPRPTAVPIPTTAMPAGCAVQPDTLLVMLPGAASRPEEFISEGFIADARERGIAADVWLVDAHVGYYRERSIVERLRTDVLLPARAQGYRRVWLVGISIGAFGSLLYSEAQPADIDGIVLLGPYLGRRETTESIRAMGGLAGWQAPPLAPGSTDEGAAEGAVWRWLQAYAEAPRRTPRPAMFLGYGRADRFAPSQRLLAAVLPPDRVLEAEGGHDYGPWRAAWRRALDAMPLRRDASCAGLG